MIVCNNVTVSYGKNSVLREITFSAEANKITVLLGKNGCGKTTLLRALSGALAYRGKISIDGVENKKISASERARSVSIMPQLLHSPAVTVRELVSFGRQPYTGLTGILSQKDWLIVEKVLHKTGLQAIAEKN